MPTLARRHATRRTAPSTLNPQPSTHSGFTLVELIIVILVLLILMTLTVALVGNMLDSDRVRGASRQIQNYLAGARDRAIYSASRTEEGGIPPRVGVRFLSDPSLRVTDPVTGAVTHRGFSSMVYVQEVAPMPTVLRIWEDEDTASPTFGSWLASQCRNFDDDPKATLPEDDGPDGDGQLEPLDPLSIRWVGSLKNRGLIERRIERKPDKTLGLFYYLQVNFDDDRSRQTFYVRYESGNVNGAGQLVQGVLSRAYFNPAIENAVAPCHFRLLPSPMPNEEPRLLPTGVVIDARSSLIGGAPTAGSPVGTDVTLENLSRADGSFDIMFNAQGVVDGPIAAAGLMHFVVADLEDLARGYYLSQTFDPDPAVDGDEILITGNAFVDSNGDGAPDNTDGQDGPDERRNDVMIVSIRTQTGSVYSSNVNPVIDGVSTSATFGRLQDPFKYAETGGEAK